MITPPRTLEALLEALGAEPRRRDAVVGDLAEEFGSLVERDGVESARSWYREQAVRAMPYLFASGWRRARWRGLGRLLGIFATAYAGVFIIELVLVGIAFGTLRTLGLWRPPPRLSAADPLWQVSMLALGTVSGTLGGYLAAWLGSEAPFFTAIAFGVVWSSVEAVGLAFTRGVLPIWYLVAVPMLILVGTTVGGILRVRQGMHERPTGAGNS